MFQDYALFPWLTVAGNIGFGPASRRPAAATGGETVAPLGHAGPARRLRAEVSARALRRHAPALRARALPRQRSRRPADGRAAGGARRADAASGCRTSCCDIWNEASRERPKSALYITHAIDEALYLSDRVIVMSAAAGSRARARSRCRSRGRAIPRCARCRSFTGWPTKSGACCEATFRITHCTETPAMKFAGSLFDADARVVALVVVAASAAIAPADARAKQVTVRIGYNPLAGGTADPRHADAGQAVREGSAQGSATR